MTWKWWAEASQNHLPPVIANQSQGDIDKNPGAEGAPELHLPCRIQGEHSEILQRSHFVCSWVQKT